MRDNHFCFFMKKTMISLLATALVTPCLAESVPALLIRTEAAEQTIALVEISKVNYTETEMLVSMRDGGVCAFVIDEITAMKFTQMEVETTAVDEAPGADAKAPVGIFRLDGTRAMAGDGKHEILIMKADKDTRKVIK